MKVIIPEGVDYRAAARVLLEILEPWRLGSISDDTSDSNQIIMDNSHQEVELNHYQQTLILESLPGVTYEPKKQWILYYGTHRGTLASRSSAPEQSFGSEEAARAAFQSLRSQYTSIGIKIWFAELHHLPIGKRSILDAGDHNYR